MESRRDFLKKSILLTGAAGVSAGLPESVQRAFAIEPAPGTSYLDAEHVVILMQENRSFDHTLGTLQGVRGFNDPRALRQPNGNSVFLQTDAAGKTYAPWRLDIKDTKATWMGSLPHSRQSQVDAWSNGHHSGWLDAKRPGHREYSDLPLTMGFYTREDLPFYYALADAFTVCDQTYCGAMTSTTPNRLLLWSGTVREQQDAKATAYMRNEHVDFGEMTWTTYPERLQQAGVSWKVYQNDLSAAGGKTDEEDAWLSNFTDNVLEFFANYNVHLSPKYSVKMQEEIVSVNAQIRKLEAQTSASPRAARQMKRHHARLEKVKREYERSQAKFADLSAAAQDLHQRAFVTNPGTDAQSLVRLPFEDGGSTQQMNVPKGDVLENFRNDVNAGALPTVTWLVAPENFSDHPSAPWYGAWYVSEALDILTKDPEVWKKTIFILTYDENDGYFDHAPSFAAADPASMETGGASAGLDTGLEYVTRESELKLGVDEAEARGGPVGLGFRVPMIVASPWTRGGWVNSQVFDQTSTIRFLETFLQGKYGKQVNEPNISPWRRAICGDMTSIFRPSRKDDAGLRFLDRNQFVASIQRARHKQIPSGFRALDAAEIQNARLIPAQEPGTRPACSIPCEPYAEGSLSPDSKTFHITMRAGNEVFASRSTGVPFNVYRYSPTGAVAATFVVQAGDALHHALPVDGLYDFVIHGPNGFYRAFQGAADDPALAVACRYQRAGQKLTGNVQLDLSHTGGDQSYTVHIRDNSYTKQAITRHIKPHTAKTTVVLDLVQHHGWYDVTVSVAGSKVSKRFAGHVETGASSFTDPLMGSRMAAV